MNTTTRQPSAVTNPVSATVTPPPRTETTPSPKTDGVAPAYDWQPSLSAASESTLRHLVHSGEAANFEAMSSEGPRLQ